MRNYSSINENNIQLVLYKINGEYKRIYLQKRFPSQNRARFVTKTNSKKKTFMHKKEIFADISSFYTNILMYTIRNEILIPRVATVLVYSYEHT